MKFKGLSANGAGEDREVAAGLGLTAEQLADRLVPDFGLDADGSMVLDYGPRRFVVGFDEQLKPYVADEAGKPPQGPARSRAPRTTRSWRRPRTSGSPR